MPPHEVLWSESDGWRCELHVIVGGTARLEVYRHDTLVATETAVVGRMATYRAEVLRQRALRGDLKLG